MAINGSSLELAIDEITWEVKVEKIQILYRPDIDDGERAIFERNFGKENVSFQREIIKGFEAGACDVTIQIMVYMLNDPVVRNLFVVSIALLIKELFDRNRERRLGTEKRPRYTNLVLRKEKSYISISNANRENKITILHVKNGIVKTSGEDYSEEKLKKLLEED